MRTQQRAAVGRMWKWFGGCVTTALAAVVLLSGCGGSTSIVSDTMIVTATSTHACSVSLGGSATLAHAGELDVASAASYVPAEFVDPSGAAKFIGYDIDLAGEIGSRLCLTTKIVNADYTAIMGDISLPPLGKQRYDMAISSVPISVERLRQVSMIPYFQAGETLLVAKGNPKGITKFDMLCGKTVAALNATIEVDELNDANGTGPNTSGQAPICTAKPITVLKESDVLAALDLVTTGHADAAYQDQPAGDYYMSRHPDKLDVGVITYPPRPQGIITRNDNPALDKAIRTALQNMMSDGAYAGILKKWGVQNEACTPDPDPAKAACVSKP